jgi:regulatory protein
MKMSQAALPGIDSGGRPASPQAAVAEAMEKAGRLLARRSHSEAELHSKLRDAGFARPTIERVIDRLRHLGLVDDHDFARQWIEERVRKKGLPRATLIAELQAKGIERAVAEDAVTEAAIDEEALAIQLAGKLWRRVADKPLGKQATALAGMLARRGFGPDACEAGIRSVLPPEGWD